MYNAGVLVKAFGILHSVRFPFAVVVLYIIVRNVTASKAISYTSISAAKTVIGEVNLFGSKSMVPVMISVAVAAFGTGFYNVVTVVTVHFASKLIGILKAMFSIKIRVIESVNFFAALSINEKLAVHEVAVFILFAFYDTLNLLRLAGGAYVYSEALFMIFYVFPSTSFIVYVMAAVHTASKAVSVLNVSSAKSLFVKFDIVAHPTV